jgi:hypothetical protein
MDAEAITHRVLNERNANSSWPAIEITFRFSNGSTRVLDRCEFYVKESCDNEKYIETLKSDGASPGIIISINSGQIKVIISQHTPTVFNRNHTYKAALKGWYSDGLTDTFHTFDIPVKKTL